MVSIGFNFNPLIFLGLYVRPQIYWQEDCDKDYDSVKSNRGPLQAAVATQYMLVIVNLIANVLALFIGISLIVNMVNGDVPWIPFEGEKEKKLIEFMKKNFVNTLRVVKVVFLIIGIGIMSSVEGFFKELGEVNCSDDLTNYTFQYLGEQIPKVFMFD